MSARAHAILEAKFYKRELQPTIRKVKAEDKTEISEIDAPPVFKELKSAGPSSSGKFIETDPLICPKCQARCASERVVRPGVQAQNEHSESVVILQAVFADNNIPKSSSVY